MKKALSLFFYILFIVISVYGQNSINNLTKKEIEKILDSKALSKEERINKLYALVEIHLSNLEYSKARELLNKIETLSYETNDSLSIARFHRTYGYIHSYENNYDKAIIASKNALNILKTIKESSPEKKRLFYSCYHMIAEAYIIQNKYGIANEYILKARDNISNSDEKKAIEARISVLNAQSIIYNELDREKEALENLREALSLALKISHKYGEASTYNNIANVYKKQKKYLKAIEFEKFSVEILKDLKSDESVGILYSNLAESYLKLNELSMSKDFIFSSIQILKKLNHYPVLALNYLYLSKITIKEHKFKEALQFLEKAKFYADKAESSSVKIEILITKSDLAKLELNTQKAISELKKALLYFDSTDDLDIKLQVYKKLAELYENLNNNEHSFFLNLYTKTKDSINSLRQRNKTDVLQVELDYLRAKSDLKAKEYSLLIEKEKQKLNKYKSFLILSLLIIIIISLSFYLYKKIKINKTKSLIWQAQRELYILKQEKADKEISFQQQQITDFALHIHEKNVLLENIKAKIKNLDINTDFNKKELNSIILFINEDIKVNKERVALYSKIDDTLDLFLSKINNRYPSLTKREAKIATLLRLEQSSKQIALQLNISPRSVDNYRISLRKKMKVPKNQRLQKFIVNL